MSDFRSCSDTHDQLRLMPEIVVKTPRAALGASGLDTPKNARLGQESKMPTSKNSELDLLTPAHQSLRK